MRTAAANSCSVSEVKNMIPETVLVAIVTGIFAVLGQWIISRNQTKKTKEDDAVRDARIEDRMKSVERKLDEHNGYAKIFKEIQIDMAVIKNELKNLKG